MVAPQRVSGGEHEHGHLEELRTDPIGLMQRVHDECGEVGSFELAGRNVVLLSGAEANEWYFRTPDSTLDQAAAYPFMTPIFGEGVVFDAPPERRAEMLRSTALRGHQMVGHAEVIAAECEASVADWDAPRTIDLLDYFAELTIYTSSACLVGPKFRHELDGADLPALVVHALHETDRIGPELLEVTVLVLSPGHPLGRDHRHDCSFFTRLGGTGSTST